MDSIRPSKIPTPQRATTAADGHHAAVATPGPGSGAGGRTAVRPGSAWPPVDALLDRRRLIDPGRTWRSAHLGARLQRDPYLLLAVALAVPVLAMEGAADLRQRAIALLLPLAFVATQVWLMAMRWRPTWLPSVRIGLSLVFVALANAWLDASGTWPLSALAIPVIAVAAARGGRAGFTWSVAGMAIVIAPLLVTGHDGPSRLAVLATVTAATLVAVGSRRVVDSLERSAERLRKAKQRDLRHARQLSAVESVGRLLALEGPTVQGLDSVVGLLEETFGYRYPSVYLWDGHALQLGAQRNYRFPIQTIDIDRGVVGRVVRAGEAAFLPDARSDPDFLSADPAVASEISIPLQSGGELFGVLNVETSGEHVLDRDDFATMQIVGDRLAVSLALGSERRKLTERAALLDRLTSFATVLGATLDPASMDDEVAAGAASVIPADMVVLVHRAASGEYRIVAVANGDASIVGREVKPGEGVTGRAIATRAPVVDDRHDRAAYPAAAQAVRLADTVAALSVPMVADDQVSGAVTWLREDLARPFSAQEREIAGLLASKVGLALANARLHQQTRDAAITDPLTGLRNRRHFDATLEREDALRQRVPAEIRRLRSAILFDLDHFGMVNKRHGHLVGDRVLRLFADTLRARVRTSDLVARFGGEEFVVVLDDASRDDAIRIAEAVRTSFAQLSIDVGDGVSLSATVSAGCAELEAWEIEGSLLLERADVALAMAKHGGRNQVVAA